MVPEELGGLVPWGEGWPLITLFYKALRGDMLEKPCASRHAWERELEGPISDTDWSHALELGCTVSCNNRFKLLHFNFLHRAYVTPDKLNRKDPSKGV